MTKKLKRLLTIALAVAMTVTCMSTNTMQASAKAKYLKVRRITTDKFLTKGQPYATLKMKLPKNPAYVSKGQHPLDNHYVKWDYKILKRYKGTVFTILETGDCEPNGGCVPSMTYRMKPTDFGENRMHYTVNSLSAGKVKFRVTAKSAYETVTWTILCTQRYNKKYKELCHIKTSFRLLSKTVKKTAVKDTVATTEP